MTREQMIDEAVRAGTNIGFRAEIARHPTPGKQRWLVKAATRCRRRIGAEFRRIAEREALQRLHEICDELDDGILSAMQ